MKFHTKKPPAHLGGFSAFPLFRVRLFIILYADFRGKFCDDLLLFFVDFLLFFEHGFELADSLILGGQFLVLFSDVFLEACQFFGCFTWVDLLYISSFTDFEGGADGNHVIVVTYGRSQREKRVVIRMVESAEGEGLLVFVGTTGDGDVPLAVRIIVDRMKARQSGCTCADFIDTVIEVAYAVVELCQVGRVIGNAALEFMNLRAVDGVRGRCGNFSRRDVCHFPAACIDAARRHGRTAFYGDAIVIDGSISCFDAVDGDVFLERYFQRISGNTGYRIRAVPKDREGALRGNRCAVPVVCLEAGRVRDVPDHDDFTIIDTCITVRGNWKNRRPAGISARCSCISCACSACRVCSGQAGMRRDCCFRIRSCGRISYAGGCMARLGCGACDIRADGVHTVRRLDDLDAVACLDIWLRRILPGEDNLLQLRHVDGIGVLRASCDARDLTGDAFGNIADRNGASCRFPGRGTYSGKEDLSADHSLHNQLPYLPQSPNRMPRRQRLSHRNCNRQRRYHRLSSASHCCLPTR